MPVDETNIRELIRDAWSETLKKAKEKPNRCKAEIWVNCLGKGFRRHYEGSSQAVFWRGNGNNKNDFGLNELLFDISVCETAKVSSIVKEDQLTFVAGCYWQVESELNDSNSREFTKDFSKLVMGRSENKLFVSSYLDKHRKAAETLCSSMAPHCQGNLYLCFIPHPRAWDGPQSGPELLKWAVGGWSAL